MPLSVSFYVRVFLTGKNKNFFMIYEQSGMPTIIEKIWVQEFFCTPYRGKIYKYSLYRG